METHYRLMLDEAAALEDRDRRRAAFRDRLARQPRALTPAGIAAIERKIRNLRIVRLAWRGYSDGQIAAREGLSRPWVNRIVRAGLREAELWRRDWGPPFEDARPAPPPPCAACPHSSPADLFPPD
jgi:hypothetical protein